MATLRQKKCIKT